MKKDYFGVLRDVNIGHVIPYYPFLNDIFKNTNATILFSQIIYYSSAFNDECFSVTDEEMCRATRFTIDVLKSARKRITELGMMSVDRKGMPARLYYTIHPEKINEVLSTHFSSERGSNNNSGQNSPLLESTTKHDSVNRPNMLAENPLTGQAKSQNKEHVSVNPDNMLGENPLTTIYSIYNNSIDNKEYNTKYNNTLPQNFSNFGGFYENSFFSANSEELGQSQHKETTSSNLTAEKQEREQIATFSQEQEIDQVTTEFVAKTENTVANANLSQKPKKEKQPKEPKEPKPKKDKPTRLLWKEYLAGYESFARAAMNGGPVGSLSGKDIKHLADIYDYFTELVIHAGLTNNKVANTDAMTLAEKKAIVAGFGLTEQVLAERVLLGFERMEKHLKDKFANGKPVIPDFVRNNPTPSNIFSQRMAIKKAIDEFKSKGGAKTPVSYQNRNTAARFGLNQSSMPEYYGEHDSNLDPLPPDAAQMISRASANAAMKIAERRGL